MAERVRNGMLAAVWDMEMLKEQIAAMADNEMLTVEVVPDPSDADEKLKRDSGCPGMDDGQGKGGGGHAR